MVGEARQEPRVRFPLSTGQAARVLDVPEPRLNDLVRRHKITPPPPVIAGRRQWEADHVAQAARALGVDVDDRLLSNVAAEAR